MSTDETDENTKREWEAGRLEDEERAQHFRWVPAYYCTLDLKTGETIPNGEGKYPELVNEGAQNVYVYDGPGFYPTASGFSTLSAEHARSLATDARRLHLLRPKCA